MSTGGTKDLAAGAEPGAAAAGGRRQRRADPLGMVVLTGLLLLGAAFTAYAWNSWTTLQASERARMALLNDFAARTFEAVLSQLGGQMRALGPLLIDADGQPRRERAEPVMRELLSNNPVLERVGLVQADGTSLYSSAPGGGTPLRDTTNAPTFAAAAAADGFVIGRTLRNPNGRWVVPLRFAVRDAAGVPRLFIAAGLGASGGGALLARIQLPEDLGLRLLRADGHVQLAHPLPDEALGTVYGEPLPAALAQQVAKLAAAPPGPGLDTAPWLEGGPRLGAAVRLAGFDFVSEVSMPRAALLEQWRQRITGVALLWLASMAALWGVYRLAHAARQRAQAAALASEARLRDYAEASADWYWETDAEHRIVRIGAGVTRQSGLPASSYVGLRRWELPGNFDPPEAPLWLAHRADLAARRSFRRFRYGGRPSGEARWAEISGRPFYDDTGRCLGYRGVGTDVTELVLSQQALRVADERIAKVFRNSPAALSVSALPEGRLLEVNEACSRLFGHGRDELLGHTLDELRLWPDAADRERFAAALAGGGRVSGFLTRGRRKDGTPIDLEVAAEVIEEHGQQLLLGIVSDITERRRAELAQLRQQAELESRVAERTQELALANRELEAFVYSVSHDLRAPLRGIDGFAKLLEEGRAGVLGEEAQSYLRRVRGGTQRMGRIIDDLLSLSRVRRADLKRVEVDLSWMARSIAAELTRSHPERQVQWRIAEGLSAQADPGLIHIVLVNLLGNAFKYTGRTPQAMIVFEQATNSAGEPEFCVRDNGAGFDMAYSAQLFEPFRRLHGQHEFEGTGVGLATVQRVIERHGGRVRGEGAVGQGAAFHFTLPVPRSHLTEPRQ